MRFTTAWAKIASQNNLLKIGIVILLVLLIIFGFVIAKLALRDPLLVERGCFSRVLSTTPNKHTKEEIESFLREALPMRFDSKAMVKGDFLSQSEAQFREKEQSEMAMRQISQKVIVNSVEVSGDLVSVDTDRLVSVGKIRSAFLFPLKVTLSDISRSESNPYGLLLTRVTPVGDKESK